MIGDGGNDGHLNDCFGVKITQDVDEFGNIHGVSISCPTV
jgi:hypothetical protein